MAQIYDCKLVLENGEEYYGYSFGAKRGTVCEIVFNTSMVGYQEVLSDPSYTYQAVVMTYPLIGNYGMAEDDYESATPTIGAMIVGEYNPHPSNFRSSAALSEVMEKYNIPGIYGIDTRKLTRSIRDRGSRKVIITDIKTSREKALKILSEQAIPADAVSKVCTKSVKTYDCDGAKYHVAAIDCGMKMGIVRSFLNKKCKVTVVPFDTGAGEIEKLSPDGVFISNGPGDPRDVPCTIETVRALHGKYPIFGICLGHQIISISYGAECFKMKFGHRGGNHPVMNTKTGKIEITSQNHSYAVDMASISRAPLTVTHINLLDNTVEGVECREDRVFSVQYHPESAPGPEDSGYLFERFIGMMQENK